MYASFFGLNEKPFSITPDPRFLFLSERHAEALAHLVYGINEAGGFIQLTGEVGTGKTTVVRSLLAQAPKHAEIALILNPRMTPAEFLLAICEELGIKVEERSEGSLKDLVDLLSLHLLTEGQMAAAFQDPPPARTADSQAAPQHPALLDFGAMLAATTNPVEHPAITAALEAGAFGDGEEDVEPIELGLTILLDGVESLVRRLTEEG